LSANVQRHMINPIEFASDQLSHEIRQMMFAVLAIAVGGGVVVVAMSAVLVGVVRVIGSDK
jgi:hypothetical protein